MQITVSGRQEYLLVTARGLLDVRTAPDLRLGLLKAAAEQPEAIVCDLRDVVANATALTVLLAVADQVARWPSSPVVVLATNRHLTDLLEGIGVPWRWPTVTSFEDVPAALRSSRLVPRARLRLPPELAAPSHARTFLAARLAEWAVRDVDDVAAALVVHELVTNAVVHAGTEIELLISARPGSVRVAVGDRSHAAPLPRNAQGGDENGRGLALVAALSSAWGVLPRRPLGKVVWAVLREDEATQAKAVP